MDKKTKVHPSTPTTTSEKSGGESKKSGKSSENKPTTNTTAEKGKLETNKPNVKNTNQVGPSASPTNTNQKTTKPLQNDKANTESKSRKSEEKKSGGSNKTKSNKSLPPNTNESQKKNTPVTGQKDEAAGKESTNKKPAAAEQSKKRKESPAELTPNKKESPASTPKRKLSPADTKSVPKRKESPSGTNPASTPKRKESPADSSSTPKRKLSPAAPIDLKSVPKTKGSVPASSSSSNPKPKRKESPAESSSTPKKKLSSQASPSESTPNKRKQSPVNKNNLQVDQNKDKKRRSGKKDSSTESKRVSFDPPVNLKRRRSKRGISQDPLEASKSKSNEANKKGKAGKRKSNTNSPDKELKEEGKGGKNKRKRNKSKDDNNKHKKPGNAKRKRIIDTEFVKSKKREKTAREITDEILALQPHDEEFIEDENEKGKYLYSFWSDDLYIQRDEQTRFQRVLDLIFSCGTTKPHYMTVNFEEHQYRKRFVHNILYVILSQICITQIWIYFANIFWHTQKYHYINAMPWILYIYIGLCVIIYVLFHTTFFATRGPFKHIFISTLFVLFVLTSDAYNVIDPEWKYILWAIIINIFLITCLLRGNNVNVEDVNIFAFVTITNVPINLGLAALNWFFKYQLHEPAPFATIFAQIYIISTIILLIIFFEIRRILKGRRVHLPSFEWCLAANIL